MTLLESSLYQVVENNEDSFKIELNFNHKIFKGHFPGSPILPGVCIIQIVKEVLNLSYLSIGSIRYFQPITPKVPELYFQQNPKQIRVYDSDKNVYADLKNIVIIKKEEL